MSTEGVEVAFLPEDFVVPTLVAGLRFRIRPITVHDAIKDLDAVMSSRERLREQCGRDLDWPGPDFTFEKALVEVAWLQREGELRRSFCYAVLSPDEDRLLGRVRIAPSPALDVDADVSFWVRSDEADSSVEKELEEFVREWVVTTWPFERVTFPGRQAPRGG